MGKHCVGDPDCDGWLRYRRSLQKWDNGTAAPVVEVQDSWFAPVVSPASHSGSVLSLAHEEGVTIFEIKSDGDASAAAAHFHKFGFVVLSNALEGEALEELQRVSVKLMHINIDEDPDGGGGEFRRWCLQRTTMIRGCLELVDNGAVCKVLQHFWDSEDFLVLCTGGNFSLPGAKSQDLHSDLGDRHAISSFFAYHDPMHPERGYVDMPTPVVKAYFTLVDHDRDTGPTCFHPGTHLQFMERDVPKDTLAGGVNAYCPKGSAVLMDMRVFHKGTANTSSQVRPMFAVHYAAPFYTDRVLRKPSKFWQYHRGALSLEQWKTLRLRQQQLCVNLLPKHCMDCGNATEDGRHGTGAHSRFWYCNHCFYARRQQEYTQRHVRTLSCAENTRSSIDMPMQATLLRAWYGSKKARQWVEVTDLVRKYAGMGIRLEASNELFTDPAHGWVKELVVQYSVDSAKRVLGE